MINAIIIDDEKHCIVTLSYVLEQIEDINLIATTQDSTKAKELIEKHNPNLVFLDIEMPILNGLDLLSQFEEINFKVVFTTAYDQYAIKALKMNALDYLLKPIELEDVEQAIEKYNLKELQTTKEQVSHLKQFHSSKLQDTLALSTQTGLLFIKIENIMYLQASGCYTYIIMDNKTKHLASKTMGNFEEVLLDNPLFFRAHKSHIINLRFIKQYIRGEGGEIIMKDDYNIALSRNKKQEFLNLFTKV